MFALHNFDRSADPFDQVTGQQNLAFDPRAQGERAGRKHLVRRVLCGLPALAVACADRLQPAL